LESPSVLINLLEQAEVPAREAGVLVVVDAREGTRVAEGAVVARIDDTEAQFLRQRAKFEMEVAGKNAANQLPILTAEKTRDVAEAIFKRTNEAAQKYRNTISQTELDRLRLDAEKGELAVRQAKHELEVAQVTSQLKQNEFDFATRSIERRRIVAPLTGVVVEVFRRRGEWVEPGQKVLRIVRLDRLRAEGFMNARQARSDLSGRSVTVTVDPAENLLKPFNGKIVFVSPEVDPVNGQVRVLAEVDNPDGVLRPGLRATMTIGPRPATATRR
jgi:macrolide-specific efflux system membrane fusion protein